MFFALKYAMTYEDNLFYMYVYMFRFRNLVRQTMREKIFISNTSARLCLKINAPLIDYNVKKIQGARK